MFKQIILRTGKGFQFFCSGSEFNCPTPNSMCPPLGKKKIMIKPICKVRYNKIFSFFVIFSCEIRNKEVIQ